MGSLRRRMKIVYKPFALIAAGIGARLGKSTFRAVWSQVYDAEPPEPTTAQTTLTKVLAKAVIEAAIMAAMAAAIDRAGAQAFEHLTGYWPGEQTPEAA